MDLTFCPPSTHQSPISDSTLICKRYHAHIFIFWLYTFSDSRRPPCPSIWWKIARLPHVQISRLRASWFCLAWLSANNERNSRWWFTRRPPLLHVHALSSFHSPLLFHFQARRRLHSIALCHFLPSVCLDRVCVRVCVCVCIRPAAKRSIKLTICICARGDVGLPSVCQAHRSGNVFWYRCASVIDDF